MLGQDFQPGLVYQDHGRWLKVKTRGSIITRGVDRPIVRLTAEDPEGTVHREKVDAFRDYRVRGKFSAARDTVVSVKPRTPSRAKIVRELPVPRPAPRPVKARRVVPGPCLKPAPARSELFSEEACYWLPPDMNGLGPGQQTIIDLLSGLPWLDAPAARWTRDGDLVEHDVPEGLTAVELAAGINGVESPALRQVHSVQRSLALLMSRGIVEESPHSVRRYRLRGWQCLHTRRRITRRAIEHGGGRAVYATVRFSA